MSKFNVRHTTETMVNFEPKSYGRKHHLNIR